CSRNCRAYADSDSTYRRWPSAKIVSKASDDLPEPDTPVITTSRLRGMSQETLRRLCCRAPRIRIWSMEVDILRMRTRPNSRGHGFPCHPEERSDEGPFSEPH